MCRKFDCILYIEDKSLKYFHTEQLSRLCFNCASVLRLHTYIIVHPSGKHGRWHLIVNIMCCFSQSWEQLLNNILQGVVLPQVAYISLHPLRLCKHIDQTQGPMSYPLLLTGKVSLSSLSSLPMFKQFLKKKNSSHLINKRIYPPQTPNP